jgi:hypothetical protein
MPKRPFGFMDLRLQLQEPIDYGLTDTEISSRGSPETKSSEEGSDSPGSDTSLDYNFPLEKQRPVQVPLQLEPLLLPDNITNYVNISDGNFGDMIAVKTKPQFVARKNSTKPLRVRLHFFENKKDNTFTKTFVYSKDIGSEPEAVLIKILSEVYYHKKFNDLQGRCKFKAPQLIEYGYVENGANNISNSHDPGIGSFMFYIKMERIDALQVSKLTGSDALAKCKDARSKLVAINRCLEENHLYHNDLHPENVMINEHGDLVVIDFGEATDKLFKIVNFDDFCRKFEPVSGGARKSRKHIKVIKRGPTKRRRTTKRRRSSRRARK